MREQPWTGEPLPRLAMFSNTDVRGFSVILKQFVLLDQSGQIAIFYCSHFIQMPREHINQGAELQLNPNQLSCSKLREQTFCYCEEASDSAYPSLQPVPHWHGIGAGKLVRIML